MGEYARLNKMIKEHEDEISELREQLYTDCSNDYEREYIYERIAELEIGIGEIRGALLENAEIDGLDDPNEAFDITY